jgi:hypothetical protein
MSSNDPLNYEKLKAMPLPVLLEELSRGSTGSTPGRDRLEVIPPFILVRTAEMVNRQLSETSGAIATSANRLTETLNHSTDTMKATLENSSEWLINALKINTETVAGSAKEIDARIGTLTAALSQASNDIQAAGRKSGEASRRLNNLTMVLAFATILLFAAGCWQAWESHRQSNLLERQLNNTSHVVPPMPAANQQKSSEAISQEK